MDINVNTSYFNNTNASVTYNYYEHAARNNTVSELPLVRQSAHMVVVYCLAYGIVILLALVGNGLVLTLVIREPSMRNVTNYFIVNLAVADYLVALIVVPMTLLNSIFSGWRYGAFLCKITPYIQGVVQCASVNTLAAIAFDRYLAICYSRHSKISACASRTTIASIWIYASTIMIPNLVYYQKYYHPDYPDVPMCHQIWPNYDLQRGYFLLGLFCLCYLLPLIMIILCYILIAVKVWRRNAPGVQTHGRLVIYKSKVKVLKMLAVIVILFAFSWLPLYGIYLRYYYSVDVGLKEQALIEEIILPIAQWLGASNCSMNPIIYCFFSKKYRRGFRKLLHCRMLRLGFSRRSTQTQMSTRYTNVENLSGNNHDFKVQQNGTRRVSSNKYMVVAFSNGKMTVSFRKDNNSDESSF